jgi:hypothetical protein
VADIGKMLVYFGVVLAAIGHFLVLLRRTNLPIGRLPGDILYRGTHNHVLFPAGHVRIFFMSRCISPRQQTIFLQDPSAMT